MSNFIQDCISGDALMSEADDYIDTWHESDSNLSLHEYLGMSREDYSLFVKDESALGVIIKAHKDNKPLSTIVREELTAMAARSDEVAKSKSLQQWLESEGLWD